MQTSGCHALLGICVFLVGCTGDRLEPVYPVSGHVWLEGKPLAEAVVVLHPVAGDGRSLTARTDVNGQFKMTTHEHGDGAPAGEYAVTIEYRELVQEGDEPMRVGRNLLPTRYADPKSSGFRCEVKAGVNELPTWTLDRR